MRGHAFWVLIVTATGCDVAQATVDASVDATTAIDAVRFDAAPPHELQSAGLCVDAGCTVIANDVYEYLPKFQLYTDGATKRRWLKLPASGRVDVSDVDNWRFPVGTKLWKEFTRDGIRVETRQLEKTGVGDGEWTYVAYAWNAAQNDVTATPSGQADANGTAHDIPSRLECATCHEGTQTRVLGLSALQLDYDAPAGMLDWYDADMLGLTSEPRGGPQPYFPLPGTLDEQAALGYLHANCGHCHNPDSSVHDAWPLELRLLSSRLAAVSDTPAHTTMVGVPGSAMEGATILVEPGQPDASILIKRLETTTLVRRMPKLGVEVPDVAAIGMLRAWISAQL